MYIVKTHIVTMFIVTKLLRRSLLRHCYGAQWYNDIVTYIVTMFIVTTTSYRFAVGFFRSVRLHPSPEMEGD